MNHLSLFSGIGGIDLAGEWAGMYSVAFCEREPFPRMLLAKRFPNCPIYDDVCTLNKEVLQRDGIIRSDRAIDIISAGFPCQPFSAAGKREGTDDERYLWPEVVRILQDVQPTWFVGENVAGILSMAEPDGAAQVESRTVQSGEEEDFYEAVFTQQERMLFGNICKDLEDIGYEVQPFVIPAAAVGAKHLRERVFIVAYSDSFNRRRRDKQGQSSGNPSGESSCNSNQPMGNTSSEGLPQWRQSRWSESNPQDGAGLDAEFERSGEVLANTQSQFKRGLSFGTGEENARSSCSSKNVAHSNSIRNNGAGECGIDCNRQEELQKRELSQHGSSYDSENVADTHYKGMERCKNTRSISCNWSESRNQHIGGFSKNDAGRSTQSRMGRSNDEFSSWLDGSRTNPLDALIDLIANYPQPAPLGVMQHSWEPSRVATGINERTARLKALGNAVDPLQIYPVMAAIKAINDQNS